MLWASVGWCLFVLWASVGWYLFVLWVSVGGICLRCGLMWGGVCLCCGQVWVVFGRKAIEAMFRMQDTSVLFERMSESSLERTSYELR